MMRRIPILFGRYLVREHHVVPDDVRRAVDLQRDLTPSLGEVALVLGALSAQQVREVRLHQRETGESFSQASKSLELLSEDEYDRLEAYRDRQKLPIGEALVLLDALDEDALETLLDAYRKSTSDDEEDAAA